MQPQHSRIFLMIPDYRNSVIVARNPGSAKKTTSYAERLRLAIAVIHGEQKEAESDEVDGRYSPPCMPSVDRSCTMDVSVGVPVHPAKEKPPINVVGDVGGRIAIMVCYSDIIAPEKFFVLVSVQRGGLFHYATATVIQFKLANLPEKDNFGEFSSKGDMAE